MHLKVGTFVCSTAAERGQATLAHSEVAAACCPVSARQEPGDQTSASPRRREEIGAALANARTQALSLYIATKSAIWHMPGHLRFKHEALLRGQAMQLAETTAGLSERLQRFTGETMKHCEFANCLCIEEIDSVTPEKLLDRLRLSNQILTGALRTAHIQDDETSLGNVRGFEDWVQEARARAWSLQEAMRFD